MSPSREAGESRSDGPGEGGADDAPPPPEWLERRPEKARAYLVLAHGSGAGMRHDFMEGLAGALARAGVATLRWEFPYMRRGRAFPDRPPVLVASVREAVAEGRRRAGDLPLFAGGKSLGGRMTSTAQSRTPLPGVRGLVFYGFPLHPAKKPGRERARHLSELSLPLLFLQGTRDRLAEPGLMAPVVGELAAPAVLHPVEGADHGFHVLKRSGRTDDQVLEELAAESARWMTSVQARPA